MTFSIWMWHVYGFVSQTMEVIMSVYYSECENEFVSCNKMENKRENNLFHDIKIENVQFKLFK